jgi:hypothetical protein
MDNPTIRTTTSREIVFGYKVNAGELKLALSTIPDHAEMTVTKYEGDAREPTETRIEASWEPE